MRSEMRLRKTNTIGFHPYVESKKQQIKSETDIYTENKTDGC